MVLGAEDEGAVDLAQDTGRGRHNLALCGVDCVKEREAAGLEETGMAHESCTSTCICTCAWRGRASPSAAAAMTIATHAFTFTFVSSTLFPHLARLSRLCLSHALPDA